ncbi:hypothetical protein M422DRAFT_775335 [Sphaerobolus stellatus SS14]|nr:hypothetical protein M422DRAFT_775335 [Sphaerobolus stellatus SS14]
MSMYTAPLKLLHFASKNFPLSLPSRKADLCKSLVECQYCHDTFYDKAALKQHKDTCEPRKEWWIKYSEELPGRL